MCQLKDQIITEQENRDDSDYDIYQAEQEREKQIQEEEQFSFNEAQCKERYTK